MTQFIQLGWEDDVKKTFVCMERNKIDRRQDYVSEGHPGGDVVTTIYPTNERTAFWVNATTGNFMFRGQPFCGSVSE